MVHFIKSFLLRVFITHQTQMHCPHPISTYAGYKHRYSRRAFSSAYHRGSLRTKVHARSVCITFSVSFSTDTTFDGISIDEIAHKMMALRAKFADTIVKVAMQVTHDGSPMLRLRM